MWGWLAASWQAAFAPISREEHGHSPVLRTFEKVRGWDKPSWVSSPSGAPHWCQSRDQTSSLFKPREASPSCHMDPHHDPTLTFSSLLHRVTTVKPLTTRAPRCRRTARVIKQPPATCTGTGVHIRFLHWSWNSWVVFLKICRNHTFVETRERNILCIFIHQVPLPILSHHSMSNNSEVLTKQSGRLTRVWALLCLSNIKNDKSEVALYPTASFTAWFLLLSLQKSAQLSYPQSITVLPFYTWGDWGSEKLSDVVWSGQVECRRLVVQIPRSFHCIPSSQSHSMLF